METILVYDHFIAKGGAEKVSFQIADAIDNCKLETAYADEMLFAKDIKQQKLKSFNFAFFKKKFPSFSLLWFYLFCYKIDDSEINLLLTGVFSPLVLFNNNVVNSIVYFHTFPSFVNLSWKQLKNKHSYAGAIIFKLFVPCYVYLLKKSLKKAQVIFSNSKSVQRRFEKLGINSSVLYPPVDLSGLENKKNAGYYLSTSRLENNKRVTLTLNAFSQLPDLKLHIVGGGQLFDEFKIQYQDCVNIKFFGWLDNQELKDQYNHCKALICIPENEYFGIAPVEAMAAGKFVIGVAEGGLLETITNDKLGILLSTPINIDHLADVIEQVNNDAQIDDNAVARQIHAEKFDELQFIRELTKYLK